MVQDSTIQRNTPRPPFQSTFLSLRLERRIQLSSSTCDCLYLLCKVCTPFSFPSTPPQCYLVSCPALLSPWTSSKQRTNTALKKFSSRPSWLPSFFQSWAHNHLSLPV